MENYLSKFNIEIDWSQGRTFYCTGSHGFSGCHMHPAYHIVGNGFLCNFCIERGPFNVITKLSKFSSQTLQGEKMCDKSEVKTSWSVRIDGDGHKRYTARFAKRDYESRDGYNHLDSNVEKSFDTFDEALKWVNDTYKSFK